MAHIIEIEKNVPIGRAKKCKVDDILYPSIARACWALHINPDTVQNYRSQFKITTEEAMQYAIERRDAISRRHEEYSKIREEQIKREEELANAAIFVFDGKNYKNFRRAVEDLSWDNGIFMNPDSIKHNAKKNGKSLQEQLSSTLRKHLARKERDEKKGFRYYENEEEKREMYRRRYKRWNWGKSKDVLPMYRIHEDAEG